MKTRSARWLTLHGSFFGWGLILAALLGQPGTARAEPEIGGHEKPILVLDSGGHSADIYGLAFTPDGKTLITNSSDSTVRFWDVATGTLVRVFRLPIYERNTGKEALSPDGRLLAVTLRGPEGDHGIALIALPEGRIVRYLKGHTDHI